jgi:hypothetical protein
VAIEQEVWQSRGVAIERNGIGHTHARASRGTQAWEPMALIECKFPSENAHRASTQGELPHPSAQLGDGLARGVGC